MLRLIFAVSLPTNQVARLSPHALDLNFAAEVFFSRDLKGVLF